MTRTTRNTLIFLILAFWSRSIVFAHMDPEGEVHPSVFVEDGKFVVYYRINKADGNGKTKSEFCREYSASGKQLKWTRRASIPDEIERKNRATQRRTDGAREYRIDSSIWSVTVFEAGEESEIHSLVWPEGRPPFEFHHDYAVAGGRIFILAYPEAAQPDQRKILTLYSFDTVHFRLIEATTFGGVAAIYHRPTASPLLPVGDRLVFAWMGTPEGASEPQFSFTVLDPLDLSRETTSLEGTYLWNTSISLAAIGNRVCIAWHDGDAYGKVRKAKIRTLFRSIDVSP